MDSATINNAIKCGDYSIHELLRNLSKGDIENSCYDYISTAVIHKNELVKALLVEKDVISGYAIEYSLMYENDPNMPFPLFRHIKLKNSNMLGIARKYNNKPAIEYLENELAV
jgi:hypothetical protein